MPEKKGRTRVPIEAGGIQVNHCKNVACANFGIPADASEARRKVGDLYTVSGAGYKQATLRCRACGEFSTVKSNQGIAEEAERLVRVHAFWQPGHCCPAEDCPNRSRPVELHPRGYHPHGMTSFGAQRYRCRECRRTFSIKTQAAFKQKKPEINELVFRLLVNKMPMRRICETAEIHPATLYGKIEFIYQQCLAYAAHHEQRLRDNPPVQRLYLAVDRQDYMFNWGTQLDRRNVMLHAIGTADNHSGYVFGMHLDFDDSLDREDVEMDALAKGDYDRKYSDRHYARLWLQRDYEDNHRLQIELPPRAGSLECAEATIVQQRSTQKLLDEDVDALAAAWPESGTKPPARGMQVRSDYTMYGHFFYLQGLLGKVDKLRFFLDQEAGIKAACHAAFKDAIFARRVDTFFVRIRKDMSIDEKKLGKAQSEVLLGKLLRDQPKLTARDATVLTMQQAIADAASQAIRGKPYWVRHPFPDMAEPEKAVCYLSNQGNYGPEHLANLYLKASLRSIDRFFMQVRRRLSVFERPIVTASRRKTWHGYSAYNPAVGIRLLAIFRVFYNYALPGEGKKTPAMRLGLMTQPASLKDILEFHPSVTPDLSPR